MLPHGITKVHENVRLSFDLPEPQQQKVCEIFVVEKNLLLRKEGQSSHWVNKLFQRYRWLWIASATFAHTPSSLAQNLEMFP